MDPILGAALIGAIPVAVVAVAGSVAQIWGPAWREERAEKRRRDAEHDALRYQRALEFIEALSEDIGEYSHTPREWDKQTALARARFVATLRPGEQVVDEYTERQSRIFHNFGNPGPAINAISSKLFAYLRGDIKAADLTPRTREEEEAED